MARLLTAWFRVRVLVGYTLLGAACSIVVGAKLLLLYGLPQDHVAHSVFFRVFIRGYIQYAFCHSLRAAAVEDGFGVEAGV
jgi:hypothetical protein